MNMLAPGCLKLSKATKFLVYQNLEFGQICPTNYYKFYKEGLVYYKYTRSLSRRH